MRACFLLSLCLATARAGGETTLTRQLNGMIAASHGGKTYSGGTKGVLIRQPDYLRAMNGGVEVAIANELNVSAPSTQVVPASFLHNDIIVPSSIYAGMGAGNGNPQCPQNNGGCPTDQRTGDSGPWNYAQLAYVVGSKMEHLFTNFDDIQSDAWGWGVFYASDANSVDHRCRYVPQYKGWDCPGYWIATDGAVSPDSQKKGSGGYPPGNPTVQSQSTAGGGTGCHFDWAHPTNGIDQTDAFDSSGRNIVQDSHCQCNYQLKGNHWQDWYTQWRQHAEPKASEQWQFWFGKGLAPSYALDFAACWVSNPRDMIDLQNTLWKNRHDWSNQQIPLSHWSGGGSERVYWGWNEVPVSRAVMDSNANWDAIVIKLPAAICEHDGSDDNVSCLTHGAQLDLEDRIDQFIRSGLLRPGADQARQRPGSAVVFLKEMQLHDGWTRAFYCEDFHGPSGRWDVKFDSNADLCYVEKSPPGPPPPPPPPVIPAPPAPFRWTLHQNKNCYEGHGAIDLETPKGSSGLTGSLAECTHFCLSRSTNATASTTGTAEDAHESDGVNDYHCDAVIYRPQDRTCYRRAQVQINACVSMDGYHLYQHSKW